MNVRCRVRITQLHYLLHGAETGFQLVKKFPAFYGTRKFITAFTSAHHLSLANNTTLWISYIHSVVLQHVTAALYGHHEAVLQMQKNELCFLASNQLDAFFHVFIYSPLYMFRASQCSSSGDRIALIRHLVWLVCVSDCLVCRSWPAYQI
jgi:hypothetical protein